MQAKLRAYAAVAERAGDLAGDGVRRATAVHPVCGDEVLSGFGGAVTSGASGGAGAGGSCESMGDAVGAGSAMAGVGRSSTQPA